MKTMQLAGGFEAESGDDFIVNSSKNYNDGNWHYSLLTFNGSSLLLFVDGKLVGNQSAITDKPDNTGDQPLRIGANSLNEDKFFTGDVDEIRVWDRALNESEAKDTYSVTNLIQQDRLCSYHMEIMPIVKQSLLIKNR